MSHATWEDNHVLEETSVHTLEWKKRPKPATPVQETMELGHHGEPAHRHALVDTRKEQRHTLAAKLMSTKHKHADPLDITNNGQNGVPVRSLASVESEVA